MFWNTSFDTGALLLEDNNSLVSKPSSAGGVQSLRLGMATSGSAKTSFSAGAHGKFVGTSVAAGSGLSFDVTAFPFAFVDAKCRETVSVFFFALLLSVVVDFVTRLDIVDCAESAFFDRVFFNGLSVGDEDGMTIGSCWSGAAVVSGLADSAGLGCALVARFLTAFGFVFVFGGGVLASSSSSSGACLSTSLALVKEVRAVAGIGAALLPLRSGAGRLVCLRASSANEGSSGEEEISVMP